MNMNFSHSNIALIVIFSSVVLYLIIFSIGFKNKIAHLDYSKPNRRIKLFIASIALVFFSVTILSITGYFSESTTPPRFIVILAVFIICIFTIIRARISDSLYFLKLLPVEILVFIQLFRVAIEILFLTYYDEKIIPLEMTMRGRNFDLYVGLLAFPFAIMGYTKFKNHNRYLIFYNVLGLVSIINIFTMAVLSFPSPFRVYELNVLPTYFPGILMALLVLIATLLHILSIKQNLYLIQQAKKQLP